MKLFPQPAFVWAQLDYVQALADGGAAREVVAIQAALLAMNGTWQRHTDRTNIFNGLEEKWIDILEGLSETAHHVPVLKSLMPRITAQVYARTVDGFLGEDLDDPADADINGWFDMEGIPQMGATSEPDVTTGLNKDVLEYDDEAFEDWLLQEGYQRDELDDLKREEVAKLNREKVEKIDKELTLIRLETERREQSKYTKTVHPANRGQYMQKHKVVASTRFDAIIAMDEKMRYLNTCYEMHMLEFASEEARATIAHAIQKTQEPPTNEVIDEARDIELEYRVLKTDWANRWQSVPNNNKRDEKAKPKTQNNSQPKGQQQPKKKGGDQKQGKFRGRCNFCNKKGHKQSDCSLKKQGLTKAQARGNKN